MTPDVGGELRPALWIENLGGYHQNCQVQTKNIVCTMASGTEVRQRIPYGIPRGDLLALERKYIYDSVDEREVARSDSMNAWQDRWKKGQTGRCTHRLIPDLQAWIGRQHGEADFYLTQFLTGHGYFGVRSPEMLRSPEN